MQPKKTPSTYGYDRRLSTTESHFESLLGAWPVLSASALIGWAVAMYQSPTTNSELFLTRQSVQKSEDSVELTAPIRKRIDVETDTIAHVEKKSKTFTVQTDTGDTDSEEDSTDQRPRKKDPHEVARALLGQACLDEDADACKALEELDDSGSEDSNTLSLNADNQEEYKVEAERNCELGQSKACYQLGSVHKMQGDWGRAYAAFDSACEAGLNEGCDALELLERRMKIAAIHREFNQTENP
jgi:hypothetical protein